MHQDRPVDVTSGLVADPVVSGEEDPDRYSKPNTQSESGSEHSFYSHKSFNDFSYGKSLPKSNSNSYRSNSSHGYSFNNSYAYSRASYSNGSHGGSSASDIISDKAESVGSVASNDRRNGRLVTVGLSGSERETGPGRRGLELIRSLGGQGDQSDDDSF